MADILIIDDDEQIRGTMESLCSRLKHRCSTAGTLGEGLAMLADHPFDVVFLDIRLPDGNGLDILERIKVGADSPEVIILTGKGDPDGAELAIQRGVWDYLLKPSPIKQITLILNRALEYRREKTARAETVALKLDNVIGTSSSIKNCYDLVAQAGAADSNVLITGETGTGKELFARTIHENSARSAGEFVVVDCASLTESLVESTLFGHKKGAYTGAQQDSLGLVKMADGGTLFLDEVGEMPLSLQKAFLRVLQERRFRPVGDTREIQSDFRLVAATNRDLEEMVEKGDFRRDLLFRIKTIHLELPALRNRAEDIKPLTMFHVNRLCERSGQPTKGFSSDFFSVLGAYDWPGNVRELFNVLERVFVAAGGDETLYAMHLPQDIRIKVTKAQLSRGGQGEGGKAGGALGKNANSASRGIDNAANDNTPGSASGQGLLTGPLPTLKEFKLLAEKDYLERLIMLTSGNVPEMLSVSGLSRSHMYALLKKNNISL